MTRSIWISLLLITLGCNSNNEKARYETELSKLKSSIKECEQNRQQLLDVIEWAVDEAVERPGLAQHIKTADQWRAASLEERLSLAIVTAMAFKPKLMKEDRQALCALALTYAKEVDHVFSDPQTGGLTVSEAFASISVLMEQDSK